jgi:hypothetical protein
MQQAGTIFEIIEIDKDNIQVILNKRDYGRPYLTAITYFGYWKNKMLEQGLRPKDKIKTNILVKSKAFVGKSGVLKYYDQQLGRQIYIVKKAPYKVDFETGELF